MGEETNFEGLVSQIQTTNEALQNNARLVINRHVTAKAWLTGCYIVEYEQKGSDRAKYGEQLLQKLAERLQNKTTFSYRSLKVYRQFYITYSHLGEQVYLFVQSLTSIGQTVSAQLQLPDIQNVEIRQSLIAKSAQIGQTVTDQLPGVKPEQLFNRLSFSHLTTILPCKDPLKRTFYETMAIRGTWSVRELQRQIDSNYYERSGWSKHPEQLAQLVDAKAETATIQTDIKSPFVFEFLGLKAKDVIEESDLETAIIDHLQDFILELGMGFCFEARQQKILIDDRYYKIDLVFYHRVLKRHVVIELKAHRLDYADVAQLNMYLGYYRKNVMLADDNEPIGILMCTEVGHEMAEYATINVDPNLFVSQYQLELPSKEKIAEFLRMENEGLKAREE
jgi:predicted nuclease of restriction endonuclease-like (RecB) superfamily